jgi:hypothetical protein
MNPVWVEFPQIPWGSVGWRMGHGEDHMRTWTRWFMALPSEERAAYRSNNVEPEGWAGFFDFVEHRTSPAWMKDLRRKLEEPQAPPDVDENEIIDYYRVVWLMRHHLKLLPYPDVPSREQQLGEGEYSVDFYHDAHGAKWRVAGLKHGGFNMRRLRHEV